MPTLDCRWSSDGDCIWTWSFDEPDDVGGAHDDVALGDGFGSLALDGGAP
ncbi:unnamed protein product, partial [Adineta steineri]